MEDEKDVGKWRDRVVQCKHGDFWETLVHFKALSQSDAACICECFIYLRYQTLSRAHWPQRVEFLHLGRLVFPRVLIPSHLRFDPVRQESLGTRSIHQRPRERPSRAIFQTYNPPQIVKTQSYIRRTRLSSKSPQFTRQGFKLRLLGLLHRFCWRVPLSEGNSEAREMRNGFLYLCRE